MRNTSAIASILVAVAGCSSSSDSVNENAGGILVASGQTQSDVIESLDSVRHVSVNTSGSENGNESETVADARLLINSSNFELLAKTAIAAINTTDLEPDRVEAVTLLNELYDSGRAVIDGEDVMTGLTLASQEERPRESGTPDTVQTYTCDDGGSLVLVINDFGLAPIFQRIVNFDNCNLSGHIHNGGIKTFKARRTDAVTTFSNYTRTSPDSIVELTGEYTNHYVPISTGEEFSWNNITYKLSGTTNDFKLDNLNWKRQGYDIGYSEEDGFVQLPDGTVGFVDNRTFSADLASTFNLISAQTQFEPLSVAVDMSYESQYFGFTNYGNIDTPTFPVAFLGDMIDVYPTKDLAAGSFQTYDNPLKDSAPQWQIGEISLTAIDGSSLLIKPDSTDPHSVLIELNNSGETVSRQWSDGYQLDCPSFFVDCGKCE